MRIIAGRLYTTDVRDLLGHKLSPEIGEISQKVLPSSLQDLEQDRLRVKDRDTDQPSPQVEYALTDLGQELPNPVRSVAAWVLVNHRRIEDARAAFAARREGGIRVIFSGL